MKTRDSFETLYVKVYRQFLKDICKAIEENDSFTFRSLIHEFTEFNLSVSFYLRSIFENDWYEYDFGLNLCPDECFWKSRDGKCECSGWCPYYSLHSRMQHLSLGKDSKTVDVLEFLGNFDYVQKENEKKLVSEKLPERSRCKKSELG